MLEIEKWAQDKSILIALFGPQTAAAARDAHEALQHIRERRVYSYKFPLPDFPSWYALYSSPIKALLPFISFIAEFSDFGRDLLSLGFAARKINKIHKRNSGTILELKPSPQELKEAHIFLQGMLSNSFSDIKDDFSAIPYDTETKGRFLEFAGQNELELGFFFLVFAPCLLLYQTTPAQLFNNAQLGDVDAIIKLLRIDPLLLHEHSIGCRIQEIRLKPSINDYERILDAARKPLNITRKKIKASFAALTSSQSKAINQPLTEPQLRDLCDKVAQDADGNSIDTDLPESPEAFAKAIQRNKPQWDHLLHPDKFK